MNAVFTKTDDQFFVARVFLELIANGKSLSDTLAFSESMKKHLYNYHVSGEKFLGYLYDEISGNQNESNGKKELASKLKNLIEHTDAVTSCTLFNALESYGKKPNIEIIVDSVKDIIKADLDAKKDNSFRSLMDKIFDEIINTPGMDNSKIESAKAAKYIIEKSDRRCSDEIVGYNFLSVIGKITQARPEITAIGTLKHTFSGIHNYLSNYYTNLSVTKGCFSFLSDSPVLSKKTRDIIKETDIGSLVINAENDEKKRKIYEYLDMLEKEINNDIETRRKELKKMKDSLDEEKPRDIENSITSEEDMVNIGGIRLEKRKIHALAHEFMKFNIMEKYLKAEAL